MSIDDKLESSVSAHQAGRLTEAKQLYAEILSQEPNNIAALHNLGLVRHQEGDSQQAIELIEMALILRPDHVKAHNNLGNALKDQGKLKKAVAAYQTALKLKPDFAEAHNNLGTALKELGKLDAAVASYHESLIIQPNYAKAHNNLGNALQDMGKLNEAVASLRKALTIKPDYAKAHNNLGIALKDMGKLDEAVASFHKALTIQPDFANAHNNLGNALQDLGKLDAAVASFHKALTIQPYFAEAHSNLLITMNYDARISQQDIFAESRRWEAAHVTTGTAPEKSHTRDRDPEQRLRIGYVSPDFRRHSVSYFLDPLIAGHDRRQFEVFCYAQVANPDHETRRFQDLADGWCSTVGMTTAAMVERIRADGIDILVDLAGHTANNRLLAFAERPAPVQMSYLGYPNTTGMSAMDYRLTDDIADPEGPGDSLHSETLVRLPNGFLCFTPGVEFPAAADPPLGYA